MNPIEPQKSEAHESTDDASTSPASNAQQNTRSSNDTQPGQIWHNDDPRQPSRTNVSAIPPVESDDAVDAPPGQVELHADLEKNTFYPTEADRADQG